MNTSIIKSKKTIKIIAVLLFFFIIIFDQIIKHSIKNPIKNTGSLFGLFQGQTHAFIYLSFIAIGLLLIFFDKINTFAFSILLSGIISNLIDRLAFGYVIDYIDLRIWPAFNIADVAITFGVILLLFIQLRTPYKA
ncbi:signal peptidase II [Candidatus Woesearchaeota archaeon]|nr:signal peptidase II [Candidatus Woesearchaeota archaeon]